MTFWAFFTFGFYLGIIVTLILFRREIFNDQAYKRAREKIINYLQAIEDERWKDAKHCSCLRHAIFRLKKGKK